MKELLPRWNSTVKGTDATTTFNTAPPRRRRRLESDKGPKEKKCEVPARERERERTEEEDEQEGKGNGHMDLRRPGKFELQF